MPETRKFTAIPLSWKRRVAQISSLAVIGEWSFYGIFRCPFAVPYIGCGNCPVVQCPGRSLWMWSWIFIGALALVFGRAFCGWICPGGLVQDLLASMAIFRHRIARTLETWAGAMKYLTLAASLWVFFAMANPRWAVPIRTGEFFASVGLTFEHANILWLTRTIAVCVMMGCGILIPHFWCRFFCPTGGALEIFRRFSFFRFEMKENCVDCDRCRKVCDLETRPNEINCSNCGACKPHCPVDAIGIGQIAQKKEADSKPAAA